MEVPAKNDGTDENKMGWGGSGGMMRIFSSLFFSLIHTGSLCSALLDPPGVSQPRFRTICPRMVPGPSGSTQQLPHSNAAMGGGKRLQVPFNMVVAGTPAVYCALGCVFCFTKLVLFFVVLLFLFSSVCTSQQWGKTGESRDKTTFKIGGWGGVTK